MVLWCKLFSKAIHSMGYFHDVTRLYTDEWKSTFLCPNRLYYLLLLNFEKFCNITVIVHIVNCCTGYLSERKIA